MVSVFAGVHGNGCGAEEWMWTGQCSVNFAPLHNLLRLYRAAQIDPDYVSQRIGWRKSMREMGREGGIERVIEAGLFILSLLHKQKHDESLHFLIIANAF